MIKHLYLLIILNFHFEHFYRVQTNFIEALPPIVEKIIYYIKNLQTSKENEFMESDMGKMLKKESRILTNGSQISPTSIVIEKIQNHHDIQNNISNQTVSKNKHNNYFIILIFCR